MDHRVIDTLIAEAIGEGPEGLAAVAHVIANRAREWGKTPEQIVTQPRQFTGYENPGSSVRQAMRDPQMRREVEQIWSQVRSGQIPDPTGGSLHYYAPQGMPNRQQPSWWNGVTQHGQLTIGNHVFAPTRPTPPGYVPTVATAQSTSRMPPVPARPSSTMAASRAGQGSQSIVPTLNANGSVTVPGPMGDWAAYNPNSGQFEARRLAGPASVATQSPTLAQQRASAPPSTIGQPSHATALRSRPAVTQTASLPPIPAPSSASRAPMPASQSLTLSMQRANASVAPELRQVMAGIDQGPQRASLPPLPPPSVSRPAPMPSSQSQALAAARSVPTASPGLQTALNAEAQRRASAAPPPMPAPLSPSMIAARGGVQPPAANPADRTINAFQRQMQAQGPVPDRLTADIPSRIDPIGSRPLYAEMLDTFNVTPFPPELMGMGGPMGPLAPRVAPTPLPMPASIALRRDPRMTGILPATMGGSRPILRLPNVAMGFAPPRPVSAPILSAPAAYQSASSSQSYHPHSSHSFFSGRDGADPYGGGGERYH